MGETSRTSNLESGISRCFHGPKNWYICSIPFGLSVETSLGENSRVVILQAVDGVDIVMMLVH